MIRAVLSTFTCAALLVCAVACSGSGGTDGPTDPGAEQPPPAQAYDLTIPTVTYAWDASKGDASVPAEMGGPGFTGEGWQTKMDFHSVANGDAPKGGDLTTYMPDWPATTRQVGKDWNTQFNYFVNTACYMGLLSLDPVTLEFIPAIATHWQESDDGMVYRFRINPEARWSDGTEITSADVVASWKLRVDPKILDPSTNVYWGRFEEPVAVSKYIVEVTVKEKNWRNFLAIATAGFWPAAAVSVPGDQYLDDFQFAYAPFSGPYGVNAEDIKTGESITLTRRTDWWAKDNPAYAGVANIDTIKWTVVKSSDLAFEKAKKGELDFYVVPKAQWWAEEIPVLEQVKRGLIRPLKIFNDEPVGTSGIAINMKRPPLDDVRIRKALQLLHPTDRMIETLYYNEYDRLTSYWQGGMYESPDNAQFEYDPAGAVALLEEAGWTSKNAEGYREKDGKELTFSLQYASALSERSLTIYQEELKDAGIRLDLQLLTPASRWQNLREKEFDLSNSAWGAIIFPNPESSWHSRYADQKDNNNVVAFANPEVDALIDEYAATEDITERAKIVQKMDAIIYNEHPYVLEHYLGCQRVLIWNKYGMPTWGASRFVDEYDMLMHWWVDPDLEKALEAAQATPSGTMAPGEREIRFWEQWNAAQATKPAVTPPAPEGDAPDGAPEGAPEEGAAPSEEG